MKEGGAIRDTQIKAIKTVFKDTQFDMKPMAETGYDELTDAVLKIVNVRKYKKDWNENFIFEVDVVVDMRIYEYWLYSNRYCEKYKVRCNGYYRRRISRILEHEFKYFGFDLHRDDLNIKKISYKEIV